MLNTFQGVSFESHLFVPLPRVLVGRVFVLYVLRFFLYSRRSPSICYIAGTLLVLLRVFCAERKLCNFMESHLFALGAVSCAIRAPFRKFLP